MKLHLSWPTLILLAVGYLIFAVTMLSALPPQAPPLRMPPQAPSRNFLCPVFPGCVCGCQEGGICFCATDYDKAVYSGKPVLIYFLTDPCPPCQTMKKVVFTDPRIVAASKDFACMHAEGGSVLAERFGVTLFPTLVVVNRGYQWRSVGLKSAGEIETFLRNR